MRLSSMSITPTSNLRNVQIMVVGASGVGKTSTVRRMARYPVNQIMPTIAVEFTAATIPVMSQQYRVKVWDIGGKPEYHKTAESYMKQISIVVVMYAVNSFESFRVATNWLQELQERKLPTILFCNKVDLCLRNGGEEFRDACRQISEEQGRGLALEYGAVFGEGSGFSDSSFQKSLAKLIYKINKGDEESLLMEDEEQYSKCCWCS